MTVITPEFINGIIRSGPLTEARVRIQNGSAKPRDNAHWDRFSSWELICEEILDTEHSEDWYDDIVAELGRRGFNYEQIDAMRRFAWRTVGWLNYDKMMWEWCGLDENDIETALAWQLKEGIITREQHDANRMLIKHPEKLPQ